MSLEKFKEALKQNLGGDPHRRVGLAIHEAERVALFGYQQGLLRAKEIADKEYKKSMKRHNPVAARGANNVSNYVQAEIEEANETKG